MLDDGDEAEILREHVHVIGRRYRKSDLELARQIGRSVERLNFVAARRSSPRPARFRSRRASPAGDARTNAWPIRRQTHAPQTRRDLPSTTTLRLTSPHAASVSASARLIAAMPGLSSRLMTPCHWNVWRDVMRNVPLACSRAIASKASHCAGVTTPPGSRPRPDHEGIGRFEFLSPPLVAQVAVVLLVGAVEFEQLGVVLGDCTRDGVEQAACDRSAQQAAVGLDTFEIGNRRVHFNRCRGRSVRPRAAD